MMNRLCEMAKSAWPAPSTAGIIQRKCACRSAPNGGGECGCHNNHTLARYAENRGAHSHPSSLVSQALSSSGTPLSHGIRGVMEERLGHDFSRVRIHTDEQASRSAVAVNSLAYTVDQHIAFRQGHYDPTTDAGIKLLAHELTHTIQQSSTSSASGTLEISSPDDAAEQEADAVSSGISGHGVHIASSQQPIIARQNNNEPVAVGTSLDGGPVTFTTPATAGGAIGSGTATQPTPCPVTPITAITDADALQMENGTRLIWNNTAAGLQQAATTLQDSVVSDHGTAYFQSAYRPQAYQTHLREVWDRANALRNNNTAACAAVRASVTAEMTSHSLDVDRPVGRNSNHSDGSAFDMSWTLPRAANPSQRIDQLAAQAGLHRPVANDPIHFTLA